MNIRILSDGKQGHLNQSLGLAQALIAKAGGAVETVDLQGLSLLGKIRKVVSGSDTPQPDPVHLRRTRHAHPAHLRPPSFQDPGCPLHEAHASLHLF